MVYSHAAGLLTKAPGASAILADLRDPDAVLSAAAEHLDFEQPVGLMFASAANAEAWKMIFVPRTGEEILRLFNGRPLVDPGLVLVSRWRPDAGGFGHNADRAWAYGGVAGL
jgi:hypothetical protein